MRRLFFTILSVALTIAANAQTLILEVGNTTYEFPAAQCGEMTFTDGNTLTINDKVFAINEITGVGVDNTTTVTDNTVTVEFSEEPIVIVAGNIAQYVDVAINGQQVKITQNSTDEDNPGEITYTLSGEASGAYADGLFYLGGEYKATIEFNGLTLTNTAGPAVCIVDGKRIDISSKKSTVNTLTGLGTKTYKGCLYVKGHTEFKGKGSLVVNCSDYHGIKSNEYMELKNCTLTVNMTGESSNLKDAIHASEYFLQESGTIIATGISTSDDAIQVELDGLESTGITTDHEDEDTGNVYLLGGTLNLTAAGTATKCLKADGDIYIDGATLTLNANGDIDLTDLTDISYTSGLKAANITIDSGSVTATVTGAAGRGIGADGTITINGGEVTVVDNGALKSSGSSYFCTAKGIKAGIVNITGGTVDVTMSGAASKGIKGDSDDGEGNINISGGTVKVTTTGSGAYDGTEADGKGCSGLNADNNITISGGTLTLNSSGSGGKCIKADQYLTISGDANISATATGAEYTYSSSITASPKAIKAGTRTEVSSAPGGGGWPGGGSTTTNYTYSGGIIINGGTIVASSTNHEAIESKSTIEINDGYIYAYGGDDAINAASDFTINGGFVMGNSSGNDGMDANGNFYIKGGTVFAIAASNPEVGIDANTEENKQLYIQGGTVVAIGGLERGSSITNSSYCKQTTSYTKGAWYALYSGSTTGTPALVFKTPSNNKQSTTMVVYTATGTPALKSSVTASGTSFWNGYGYTAASGGSNVTLSNYSNSSGGGPGGW